MAALNADFCVIGGGIAGLVFARRLLRQKPQCRLLLLDAGAGDSEGKSIVINDAAAAVLREFSALPANSRRIRRARVAFAGAGGGVIGGADDCLGYGICDAAVLAALREGVERKNARALKITRTGDAAVVHAADGDTITARFLVIACALPHLPPPFMTRAYTYRQGVLSLTAAADDWPDGFAAQIFTRRGVVVFVPRAGGDVGVIVCAPPAVIGELNAAADADLSAWLREVGGIPLAARGRRFVYAPQLTRARPLAAGNIALVGAAAGALHPAGAQAISLGIADACRLADLIAQSPDAAAAAYARARAGAHRRAAVVTSALALGAHLRARPFRLLGGAGAMLLTRPPLRAFIPAARRLV